MEKPRNISEYTVIEQQAIIDELDRLLSTHTEDYYGVFYNDNKYSNQRTYKNIFFYVPVLNSFFYVNTNYLSNFFDKNFNSINSVGEFLMKYNRNEIFNIKSFEDIRYGYFYDFSSRSLIYNEVINLFKENNKYSGIDEFKTYLNAPNYQRGRYVDSEIKIGLLNYAMKYIETPQIEKMVKSGFGRIVNSWLHSSNDLYSRSFKNGNNMNEITKLPKFAWQSLQKEGISDIGMWNEYRIWIQKDNLSKDQLDTILNLNVRDASTIKAIRSILNSEYNNKKLYTLYTLLNYLSRVDMYQAISINDSITILRDYIKMCLECNIEPLTNSNSLKREHDVVLRNYNLVQREKYNEKEKEKQITLNKKIEDRLKIIEKYKYKDNELEVIFPQNIEDLFQEGRNNHNCVGSYCDRYANGSSNIGFIRKIDNPEQSYITIEVNSDFTKVNQAFYSSNRDITSIRDIKFIESWIEHNKEINQEKSNEFDRDITDDMY